MQPLGKGGKMKHWKVISVILVFIGITWTGCTRDLYNVQDTPVPSFKDRSLSLEEVKNAIMRSKGTSYVRYEMHDIEPGLIRCQLKFKKKHRAWVDIPYSQKSYSIQYKSSQNLRFQPPSEDNPAETIHRHYNTWIRDLDQSTQMNMSVAQANH